MQKGKILAYIITYNKEKEKRFNKTFSNYPQKSRNFLKSIVQLAIQPTSTHQPTSNWEIEISI
jgi:hypothetical protein